MPVEVLKISSSAPESHIIDYAATFIQRGQVIGIPTDTVYGLSADPFNLSAIEQVFHVKGRPDTRALPILVSSIEQAATLARDLPEGFLRLADKFWPGPLTIVVEATHRLPLKVTGNSGRVALRWPNSPIATALIDASGGPVTGTSANLSGYPTCTNAAQIVEQLGERLQLVLDSGETGATQGSTIVRVDDDHWSIIREGAVTEPEIKKVLEAK